ncbi:alanine--tRNA ligase [candidate division WOR-3 bacterium]|nr:alanine--tRNA ligase [candidate division WOR-3 bacterium]
MRIEELRNSFIEYFRQNSHAQITGAPLIPENDPTVLFTTAGMHPLVPYLMGEKHPSGKRLCNWQKCVRTGDIDEVGDSQHLTFFEMLGNWSLGDYFKEEAVRMSHEFLTSKNWLSLDGEKLFFTVFEGDADCPRDEETAGIWKECGVREDHILFLPKKDNWWGPAGKTGPCGPDTEMFYDTLLPKCSTHCSPGCPCGKYVEIWNDVFMQFNKTPDKKFELLKVKNVDTGMGLERTAAVLNGYSSVYETEKYVPLLRVIEDISGKKYGINTEETRAMRIITDHMRSAFFIIGDELGVKPSNLDQGYIVRRLVRRAMRYSMMIGIEKGLGEMLADLIIETNPVYEELGRKKEFIVEALTEEEQRFRHCLNKGMTEFSRIIPNIQKGGNDKIPGRIAFRLYDTYGFPLEMTEELAREKGFGVDVEGFEKAYKKHQEISRAGSEVRFKGGLADASEQTKKLHTATHLLHEALRKVLGKHVAQKGSNITPERLRFDFSHPKPMTEEEVKKVEKIVNEAIEENFDVVEEMMSVEEAKEKGAVALFTDKYSEKVKVYSIGGFSKEVCGGPHVEKTGELGKFKILKEQSSSSGVRRIKAVLE